MPRTPQLTTQTVRVLTALYNEPGSAGSQVCRDTGLPSGTVYPILARLEEAGWLHSAWEAGDPSTLGRPRRRFYTLTAVGAREAQIGAQQAADLYAGFAR
jgi:DNA-binding MarR family transcriptional regulator